MADLKISQLTGATTPLAGTEVLPIVQSSTTKQVSVANLTAGRAIAALSGSFGSSGTGANLNTKPNAYGLGTAIVPSFVMESNASGGTATLPSSQGAVIWELLHRQLPQSIWCRPTHLHLAVTICLFLRRQMVRIKRRFVLLILAISMCLSAILFLAQPLKASTSPPTLPQRVKPASC